MNAWHRALALLSTAWLTLALNTAGAAPPASEGRLYLPGSFERLELDGSAQITLTQGERDQVFIVGDADVQRGVAIELANDRLRISPAGGWKFWKNERLQIEVQMRKLSRVSLSGTSDLHAPGRIRSEQLTVSISGSGQVRFDDLEAAHLHFDISGAGDGQLAGEVDDLSLAVSGKGKLQAERLRATSAKVSISGVGNATLWVTDGLRVSISGVGTVDYWGQPQVVRSIAGLGSLTPRGNKR
jgi:hypothetical protein